MDERQEDRAAARASTAGAQQQGDAARANEENELEAEQESAEAMDAEVPQPPGAAGTTEGQPS
ncbi:MAG TPA: hypothetical protein VM864_02185 [Pyrinomonadaceae bacterium]|jgi:hypothetical protein|nr:hypothetical protein [Pyrinomonadaceae bacterium]